MGRWAVVVWAAGVACVPQSAVGPDDDSPGTGDDEGVHGDDTGGDDDTAPGDDDSAVPDACDGPGFERVATDHTLPPGYPAGSFPAPSGVGDCAGEAESPSYSTMDLDGDGLPDLLVTEACGDDSVGDTAWRLHRGAPGGFEAASGVWSLPGGVPSGTFRVPARALQCDGVQDWPAFSLVDLDGDGAPDLVVTAACDDPQLGTAWWWLYRNTGSGFDAAPRPFLLPAGYAAGSFPGTSGQGSCAGAEGTPAFALMDLVPGGGPDLVVTQACGASEVGTSAWRVHQASGTGFADDGVDHALPGGYPDGSFDRASRTLDCADAPEAVAFTAFDLDQDGLRDLVITGDCSSSGLGVDRWDVHLGSDLAFASEASTWALPPGPAGFPFPSGTVDCGDGSDRHHGLVRLDGDERSDLLVTRECGDPEVGTSTWSVFPGEHGSFGEGLSWPLPEGFGTQAFSWASDAASCGDDRPAHTVNDLDADGRPDLVLTMDCQDTGVGDTHWRVFRNRCDPGPSD